MEETGGRGREKGGGRVRGGGQEEGAGPPPAWAASCPRTVAGLALDGDAWEVTEVVIARCGRPPRELAPRWRTEPILRSTASRARPFTEFPSPGCSQGATLGASGLCGAWAPVCFLRQGNMSSTDPAGASRRSHAAPLPPACGLSADSGHPSPPSAETGARWRDPPRTSVVRTRLRRPQPGFRVVAAGGGPRHLWVRVPCLPGPSKEALPGCSPKAVGGPTTRADVPRATCPHRHVAIGRRMVPTPVRGRVRVDAVLRRGCLWSCTSPTTSLAEAKRKQEK